MMRVLEFCQHSGLSGLPVDCIVYTLSTLVRDQTGQNISLAALANILTSLIISPGWGMDEARMLKSSHAQHQNMSNVTFYRN
jgi:hypothetical protein